MVIKYIGRTTTFKGKPLWEILGNLKNNGVGRMVIRSQQQRYPEPSYLRILKVAALPNANANFYNPRKVVVLVEKTFRGKTFERPVQIDSVTYKADYILIPKDQEAQYSSVTNQPVCRVMPKTTDFPPLLKEILKRQKKQTGEHLVEEERLTLRYNLKGIKNYRIMDENETHTVNVQITRSPKLYMNDSHENPL